MYVSQPSTTGRPTLPPSHFNTTITALLVRRVGTQRRVVLRTAANGRPGGGATTITKVLLAQGGEALFLGDGVDVGADDEGHEVEEGHPGLLGQELLGEGQADGRRDPAHAHHFPEAGPDGGLDLVEVLGTGDERHGDQVDAVLDGRDLGVGISMQRLV